MTTTDSVLAELARQLLGTTELRSFSILGDGTDHLVAEVNGRFIIRQRKLSTESVSRDLQNEVRLLGLVADVSPIPVPEVVEVDYEAGVMLLRKLPGASLLDQPCLDRSVLVGQLAQFFDRLGTVPIGLAAEVTGRDEYGLPGFLEEATLHLEAVTAHLSDDQRRAVESFLSSPVPPEPSSLVFCHHDLGAEHILASTDRSRITGIIDWSDAAITDPARDLGRLYRDFGSATVQAILDAVTLTLDDHVIDRTIFHARCALLEDLAFGLGNDRQRYVGAALDRLNETFPL